MNVVLKPVTALARSLSELSEPKIQFVVVTSYLAATRPPGIVSLSSVTCRVRVSKCACNCRRVVDCLEYFIGSVVFLLLFAS